MRGCDNFCSSVSFPIPAAGAVPRSRGHSREARQIAALGFKQITLLGQNVNSYRFSDWDFARLITAVADVPGSSAFVSPPPIRRIFLALLEAVALHPKICKHIHLPLQSGNDRILDMMNRTYTRSEYCRLSILFVRSILTSSSQPTLFRVSARKPIPNLPIPIGCSKKFAFTPRLSFFTRNGRTPLQQESFLMTFPSRSSRSESRHSSNCNAVSH